jgi:hypothetical protein
VSAIPSFLLRHTMTVEPYLGQSGAAPLYGPAVTVPCFCDDRRRQVRDQFGEQVISEATVYCLLATDAPVGSRITVNGRTGYVITASRRDGGGLPTPDHLELALT